MVERAVRPVDCTVGTGLVLGQRQGLHRAAVVAEVVEAGSCEPGLGQSAGHRQVDLQSEGLAPDLVHNTAPGVQRRPEKVPVHAELLPLDSRSAALVGSGVAGEVTALQEDLVDASWEHSELAGQALYAWSAIPSKRPSGRKEQAPAVAGTLGEGDSDRAAGVG